MGGEVKMVPALVDALRGIEVPLWVYEGDLEPDRVTSDSENLIQLAAALAYINACIKQDWNGIKFWTDWWMKRLAWERKNFMGKEMAGRTYPGWHFMPKRAVLEVARKMGGNQDLITELESWMTAFLVLAACATGKKYGREITNHRIAEAGVITGDGNELSWCGKFCAWSGDRTDSRMNDKDARDNNVPTGSWWGWLSISTPSIWLNLSLGIPVGSCQEKDVEIACSTKLFNDDSPIKNDLKEILNGGWEFGFKYLKDWFPQVPIRVRRTTQGVATISPEGRSSSTPHSYAVAQWDDTGIIKALYADTGWRDASGDLDWIVSGTATLDGDIVTASRSDGKYGSPHSMELPGGDVLLDFEWGPNGLEVFVPKQADPIQPPIVTPPTQLPQGGTNKPSKKENNNGNIILIGGLLALLAGIFSKKKQPPKSDK